VVTAHPVPIVVARLHERVKAAAAALAVSGDAASVIRVDLGDPGEFEEMAAIGVGLGASAGGQVDDPRPRRTLGFDEHDFTVDCLALAWSGGDDRSAVMVRVFEVQDVVRDVLAAGLDLPFVESARLDRSSFSWIDDGRGVKGQTEFAVRVKARRPRR
jgi:hypothetical protein